MVAAAAAAAVVVVVGVVVAVVVAAAAAAVAYSSASAPACPLVVDHTAVDPSEGRTAALVACPEDVVRSSWVAADPAVAASCETDSFAVYSEIE